MKASGGSSPPYTLITERRQAEVVTSRDELRRLAPFMGHEACVSEAARRLGLGITATYKLVARFVALGLLEETRQQRRAGRAIRYYRAPATFFVPFHVLGLEEIGERNRLTQLHRFERSFAASVRHGFAPDWGALTGALPSGETYYEIASPDGQIWDPLADDATLILSGWNLIRATPQEARTLQRGLMALITPYLNREGGEQYLLGTFLCRDHADHQT
ncbi:hypothetical protein [Deinococcus marmoris]|uniref:hypothetical protein n=1 Tax=Deinococcus marmoris TaxID=249408 RepID=UPI000A45318C|nr:hypothetical protein [Deinococcus marmoris]